MMRMPIGWHKGALALLLSVAVVQASACTPPRQRAWSGFARAGIGHLPKNALGVMFYPASRTPRPADFRVTSAEDKRPLPVRVRAIDGAGWVRIEPVHGFQPGARYRFRYVPRHGDWKYPDETTVAIDDAAVTSDGDYAIDLTPTPVAQVVLVPTSSGSCVEPAPSIVQSFTYRIPPALLPYRDALVYDASIASATRTGASVKPSPILRAQEGTPVLYETEGASLGQGYSKRYTTRDNAVVAACGTRWPRMRVTGHVGFPELDPVVHRTPTVEFDLNEHVEGSCDPLDALLRSVDWRAPEPSLRELCHMSAPGSFSMAGQPLRAVDPREWAFHLSMFEQMSATCTLVALAHLWHTEQASPPPAMLGEFGAAIESGWRDAAPADRDAAVHALAYLTDQLPQETRAATARQLLAPLRAALEQALAGPHPARPEELAKLIALAR